MNEYVKRQLQEELVGLGRRRAEIKGIMDSSSSMNSVDLLKMEHEWDKIVSRIRQIRVLTAETWRGR